MTHTKARARATQEERVRCAQIVRDAELAPDTVDGMRQRALKERILAAIEERALPPWPIPPPANPSAASGGTVKRLVFYIGTEVAARVDVDERSESLAMDACAHLLIDELRERLRQYRAAEAAWLAEVRAAVATRQRPPPKPEPLKALSVSVATEESW